MKSNRPRVAKCFFKLAGGGYIEITAKSDLKGLDLHEFIEKTFRRRIDKEDAVVVTRMESYHKALVMMQQRQESLEREAEAKKIEWEFNHPGMSYHQRQEDNN